MIRRSPRVFVVIVAQLVTQPPCEHDRQDAAQRLDPKVIRQGEWTVRGSQRQAYPCGGDEDLDAATTPPTMARAAQCDLCTVVRACRDVFVTAAGDLLHPESRTQAEA